MSDRLIHAILTPCPAPYVALCQPNDAGVPHAYSLQGDPHGQA